MVRSTSVLGYSINIKVLANITLTLITVTSALLAILYRSKAATYVSIILAVLSAMGTTALVIYEERHRPSRNEVRSQAPLLIAMISHGVVYTPVLYQQGNPPIHLNLPLYGHEQLHDTGAYMHVAGIQASTSSTKQIIQWLQSQYLKVVQRLWYSKSAQNATSRREE